jgi:hypothetical protein
MPPGEAIILFAAVQRNHGGRGVVVQPLACSIPAWAPIQKPPRPAAVAAPGPAGRASREERSSRRKADAAATIQAG